MLTAQLMESDDSRFKRLWEAKFEQLTKCRLFLTTLTGEEIEVNDFDTISKNAFKYEISLTFVLHQRSKTVTIREFCFVDDEGLVVERGLYNTNLCLMAGDSLRSTHTMRGDKSARLSA